MPFVDFSINLAVALAMGILIGLERQYRQHPAGLRTNALVSVGAALFVSLDKLSNIGDTARMAPYVVSGIGFLGGGLIIHEGTSIKGMSTAATIWCTAAIGILAGSGFPIHAVAGTFAVLFMHLALRPVGRYIDAMIIASTNVESLYRLHVVCEAPQETLIRSILAGYVDKQSNMVLRGISTEENVVIGRATVIADIYAPQRNDRVMHDFMSRLNSEPSVKSVQWDAVHSAVD